MDEVAARLSEIRDKYGPRSIATYYGTQLQNVPAGAYTMEVRSKRKTITIPVKVTGAAYTDVPKVTVGAAEVKTRRRPRR